MTEQLDDHKLFIPEEYAKMYLSDGTRLADLRTLYITLIEAYVPRV